MPSQRQFGRDLQLRQCVRFKSSSVPETILSLLCSIATGKINRVRLELMLCKTVYSWKLELGKKLYRARTGDQLWPNMAYQLYLNINDNIFSLSETSECLCSVQGQKFVMAREGPHGCMEPAQFQQYLGANKPSLNMEGFDTKSRDRVFLH